MDQIWYFHRELKRGCEGPDVERLVERLRQARRELTGLEGPLLPTSSFSKAVAAEVAWFQTRAGLPATGLFDFRTYQALYRLRPR